MTAADYRRAVRLERLARARGDLAAAVIVGARIHRAVVVIPARPRP